MHGPWAPARSAGVFLSLHRARDPVAGAFWRGPGGVRPNGGFPAAVGVSRGQEGVYGSGRGWLAGQARVRAVGGCGAGGAGSSGRVPRGWEGSAGRVGVGGVGRGPRVRQGPSVALGPWGWRGSAGWRGSVGHAGAAGQAGAPGIRPPTASRQRRFVADRAAGHLPSRAGGRGATCPRGKGTRRSVGVTRKPAPAIVPPHSSRACQVAPINTQAWAPARPPLTPSPV